MREMKSTSDANSALGTLHQQLLNSQLNETTALRKLENAQNDVSNLSSKLQTLEKFFDEKVELLFKTREDFRTKNRTMQLKIDELLREDKYLTKIEALALSVRTLEAKRV